ncbi:MAG: phosphatase PAP2 family protein [Bacteroidia bacterium]|nr:phosphatase PAP2 family protein [Bacteroidia bacterium]
MELEIQSAPQKTIGEKLAKFISYVFHPLLMPTYGFLALLFTKNYISTFTPLVLKIFLVGVTFVFTFIMPAINALILLRLKRIKSLEMENSEERYVPYISTALFYFSLYYLFHTAGDFPSIFKLLILGAAISILLTLIINLKWKISAHAIGIGGTVAAIIGISFRLMIDLQLIAIISILVAGLVGFARLKLNAHTPAQVYTGFLLGFLVEFTLMLFL